MKIILGIILVGLCVYLGYFFSSKYIDKRKFYEDFWNFNKKIKNEVSFSQKTINKMIDEQGEKTLFYQTFENEFNEKSEKNDKIKFLSKNEKEFFREYVSMIGKSDNASQISYIDSSDTRIKELLDESSENEKKYKSLYIKLGFLLGVILFIAIM